MRRALGVTVFVVAVSLALAQQAPQDLQAQFLKLAREASKKTVGIVSYVESFGAYGNGTGAIISPDGYILTCDHVVPNDASGNPPKEIIVVLPDGRRFKAKKVAACPDNDYALLKIEAENLPYFELGDSGKVKLGDWVAALGHPGGIRDDNRPSFSVGRVIGLKKKAVVLQMGGKFYPDAIATDIPLAPGNSGGPLVDLQGRLIGINGAVILVVHRSYSTPINRIKANLDSLKAGKNVKGEKPANMWAAMQEMLRDLDPETMKKVTERIQRLFSDPEALKQLGEMFGGPAKKWIEQMRGLFGKEGMGELFGDLQKLMQSDKVQKAMEELMKAWGDPNADPQKLQQKMGELFRKLMEDPEIQKLWQKWMEKLFGGQKPPFPVPAPQPQPQSKTTPRPKGYLGVKVAPVSSDLADFLGIKEGLVVKKRDPAGPAAKAGLQKGDVIVAVNGKPVGSIAEMAQALKDAKPGDKVRFDVVRRGGKRVQLEATLGEWPKEK